MPVGVRVAGNDTTADEPHPLSRIRRHSGLFVALALGLAVTACTPTPISTTPAPSTSVPAPPNAESPIFSQTGLATWYGGAGQSSQTASGEAFDGQSMTAAHRRLAFGTIIRVICLANGRMVKVRINDRGPYTPGRIIDLSAKAAELLGVKQKGTAEVRIEEFVSDQP